MLMVKAAKVRRVLGIAHDALEIPDSDARLRYGLAGICELVGADIGVIFVFGSAAAAVPLAGAMHGMPRERERAVMAEYAMQGDKFDLIAQRLRASFSGAEPVLAKRRQDLVDARTWYNSEYFNEFRRNWGFDHSIYSMLSIGSTHTGMSVNRSFGGKAFNVEDRSLIELFHLAVAKVAKDAMSRDTTLSNDARRAELSPRTRDTLACLLRGISTKDIAEELTLSENTVRHYTKAVFRTFKVTSRSELVARWFSGR
jgi:DNA-binding CsgD family transcriptional regulator